jgi:type II secretory pathway pseudopilin PulG
MKRIDHTTHRHSHAGFTVVELLVTLAIVVLVTGVVMLRYSSFNSSVLLTSQAYLTAFDIREAQSLAISVRGNSSEFREEYGIYFDMGNPNVYRLFQDDDANGEHTIARYNAGEEVGDPIRVDPRFTILNICATNTASRSCYADDPDTTGEVVDPTLSNITIAFKRPDFDATLYSAAKSSLQSIEVIFGSADNEIRKKVLVYTSGQIAID